MTGGDHALRPWHVSGEPWTKSLVPRSEDREPVACRTCEPPVISSASPSRSV